VTHSRRTTVAAAVIAATALVATGCRTNEGHADQDAPFHPSLASTQCPADIDDALIGTYACSFLTVREGGADPSRTIRLLVTQLQPTDGVKHKDPVIVVGENFAAEPYYAGIAPLADRVGRTVIFLDQRGVGHSQPSLDCPEVDGLGPVTLAAGTDDPTTRRRFLTAVRACHDRLARTPIDLAAYNVPNAAGDVIALAQTLRLRSWNVGSFGTSSRIALQLLQSDPRGLRAMFLDSPELPADDPRQTASGDTAAALRHLLSACARSATCLARLPHTTVDVNNVLADLNAHPISRTVSTRGADLTVRFDGAMTLRIVRYMLAQNGAGCCPEMTAARVLALLDTLEHGHIGRRLDGAVVAPLTGDQPYCEGYLPSCAKFHSITTGAYFSALCHDLQPFRQLASVETAPGWSDAYGHSPYLDVCASWPVAPAKHPLASRFVSDVPTLVLIGGYDPFANLTRTETALAGMAHHYIVTSPIWGHNVIGSGQCAVIMRNAWLDSPQARPDSTCLTRAAGGFRFATRL
jgi:pimeloyl-ACP methyl ester carboxylesterase